jgi:4-hydroxy-4-methyl-2-oxoglutarate aldolase
MIDPGVARHSISRAGCEHTDRLASMGTTTVPALLLTGNNWMMHVAAEQIHPGNIVVTTVTADCTDRFFGDLLVASFTARGARALVFDAGTRDVATLNGIGFPVRSKAGSSKGRVKAMAGPVNIPAVCAGRLVTPDDAIVADDGGVAAMTEAAPRREANEGDRRAKLGAGILGLDLYNMRGPLVAAGLRYLD